MIDCPQCHHHNPEGATQCESCYAPLPQLIACPNCGGEIQSDALFCGQCGHHLQPPFITVSEQPPIEKTQVSLPPIAENPSTIEEAPQGSEVNSEVPISSPLPSQPTPVKSSPFGMATQLQIQTARLLHLSTQTSIELPNNLTVIHIGKPNEQIPPDVDVSGFAHSEVVSRIHADIRVEGDTYYLEDTGSANGTYVNHTPLPKGNRHRLRSGDRISLGKGDLVTFIFQG